MGIKNSRDFGASMEEVFHERTDQCWALGLRLWWAVMYNRTRGSMWLPTCEQSARVSDQGKVFP